MNHQRLKNLIEKYLNETATDLELKELNDWYAVDYGSKGLDQWIKEEHGLENITNRMFLAFKDKIDSDKKLQRRILHLRIAGMAASILLCLGLFVFIYRPAKHNIIAKQQTAKILPGSAEALLTLANGRKILLNSMPTGKITLLNGAVIIKKRKGLVAYIPPPESATNANNIFNSIETPRGGQYQVVLPDGTNVWLNAASKLTYPTRFNSKQRIVKLSGEAYFEVAHDPDRPFHVLFAGQDVRVLGTHFNINAYPDDKESKTTLLQGSISLTKSGAQQPVLLIPGQQATLPQLGEIAIHVVNTDQVVSWKNGYFQFDDMNISSIMKVLGRWYDVSIQYKNVDQKETFGGTFSRDCNLNDILKNIENIGDAHFELAGRTIIVDSKKGGL